MKDLYEKICILIIEDDEEDVFIVRKVLSSQKKWTILVSRTIKAAEDVLKKENIDVVLLDLNLPDGSGSDTIRQIMNMTSRIPIIVLTGSDNEETSLKALENGADDYLSKNEINRSNLIRIIMYSLERKKLHLHIMDREEKLKELYRELEEKNSQLSQMAIKDSLTGLFNRRYIDENLKREISTVKRNNSNLFFMIFDIDDFKFINDTYGHAAGDAVLVQMSQILQGICRDSDVCGRFGGDEFIIFGSFVEENSLLLPKRLLMSVRNSIFKFDHKAIDVSISIGVSVFDTDKGDAEQLFSDADNALYRSKKEGKNTAFCFCKSVYSGIDESESLI